ncbi:hypothetical protein DPMN_109500 [Dreissena polymorpha]|uniref:Uncharacterized protein n=1 Tax=Dreissena polymorpha TaxID=45954 RepID=A0A9D4QN24_DREPO|nr:hypothetical protein DPMN_109500 [Dreissena polymorpha]
MFHEDWTINVTSRVLTRKIVPPLGSHVFQRTGTILKLSLAIIRTNVLTQFHEDWTSNVTTRTNIMTKFHEDWNKNKTSRVLTRKTSPLPSDIIGTNLLTKFEEDWTINATSRVLTSFSFNLAYFELNQFIIRTNLLTKFHEDQTINVASRVLTRQNADDERRMMQDRQNVIPKAHHNHEHIK